MQKSSLGSLFLFAGIALVVWGLAPFFWSFVRAFVGFQLISRGLRLRGMAPVSAMAWQLSQNIKFR